MAHGRITHLDIASFVRVCTTAAALGGAVVGAYRFVASLFGADVSASLLGMVEFNGIAAGVANLILAPLSFAFAAGIVSTIFYYPFKWALRWSGGIDVQFEPRPRKRQRSPPAAATAGPSLPSDA